MRVSNGIAYGVRHKRASNRLHDAVRPHNRLRGASRERNRLREA